MSNRLVGKGLGSWCQIYAIFVFIETKRLILVGYSDKIAQTKLAFLSITSPILKGVQVSF